MRIAVPLLVLVAMAAFRSSMFAISQQGVRVTEMVA
jgi:hypothetical protein